MLSPPLFSSQNRSRVMCVWVWGHFGWRWESSLHWLRNSSWCCLMLGIFFQPLGGTYGLSIGGFISLVLLLIWHLVSWFPTTGIAAEERSCWGVQQCSWWQEPGRGGTWKELLPTAWFSVSCVLASPTYTKFYMTLWYLFQDE